MSVRSDIPVISLFSGAGGLDTGFAQAGFAPILAVDANEAACETLATNHPGVRVLSQDLAEVDSTYLLRRVAELPQHLAPKGVIGGPPCQAFSLSNGYKKPDDPRAMLSVKYANLLRGLNEAFNLDFFVFENVVGLGHLRHREDWAQLRRLFGGAGFSIFEGTLDAKDFGVAQERKRIFVVGFNKRKYPFLSFTFPRSQQKPRTVRDAIGSLPAPIHFDPGLRKDHIPHHPNHWCMRPRSPKFFDGSLREGDVKGRPFRVLSWDRPSWTVAYGHREVHIHPTGKRRLSVYEAMRLQGFPSQYELCGGLSDQLRLVSDAVPPPLARALAKSVYKALVGHERRDSSVDPAYRMLCRSRESSVDEILHPRIGDRFFVKYGRNSCRDFPWRDKRISAFHLLLAELLLKQTKAESVVPVWKNLVRNHPTPKALAVARRSKLEKLLLPLGFQRQRAANLKRLSQTLVLRFNGSVPSDIRLLLSLPGIGLYTATALACFKFGDRVPIVDANVLRVFSRLYGDNLGKDLRRSEKAWAFAWNALPLENWQLHNYGILDFAAQLCSARPKCASCPLRDICAFARLNNHNR